MTTEQAILQLIFPENIFEWFDVISGKKDDKIVSIVFEEKNIPPLSDANKKIISKGFTDIIITDFPIRGRRSYLTFRRRYWQIEGQKELVKRDIHIRFWFALKIIKHNLCGHIFWRKVYTAATDP